MARVPSLDPGDLSDEYAYLLERNELGALDIFRTLANNPPVLQSYMRWGTTLWEDAGLDRREVELVILTVAARVRSRYEWHQHVPIGLDAGLTRAELRAVRDGAFADLDGRDGALAGYAAAVADGEVDDAVHAGLAERVDDGTVVGVALLAGHYLMTARVLDALGVEPEDGFVGWDLSGLG